ncbi:MAG: GNAT family N-acetyltransferase [Oscillospiraceae bacterium]|nr:GNAT family N-acetyltransferase [Oscillospiraceae bacterium]
MYIETERLIIKDLAPDMAEDVFRNSLDEDIGRFVPDERYESKEDALAAIEFIMSRYDSTEGPFVYAVFTKDTHENTGYVQMVPVSSGEWEIGYHIAQKFTHKGYATEAVRAFIPVMTEKLDTDKIIGVCLSENAASKRVLLKCGFVPVYEGVGEYQGEERDIFKGIYSV